MQRFTIVKRNIKTELTVKLRQKNMNGQKQVNYFYVYYLKWMIIADIAQSVK